MFENTAWGKQADKHIIVLTSTNPNENDFKNFLKKYFIETGYKDEELVGLFSELIASPTTWAINKTTERKNYYVFSLYTITVMGSKYKFIGIGNNFFESNKR